MEIQKQFSFVGNLRKLHEEDNQPIENFSANIQCRKDGAIFLEIDSIIYDEISHKKFYESTPTYRFVNLPEFTENEMADPLFFLRLDRLERELAQEPYEGDYIIEGETNEKWSLRAEIAEPNFPVTFRSEDAIEDRNDTQQYYLVRLRNLSVDYHPDRTEGQGVEAVYGLANLQLIKNLSTHFLESKYEFCLVSLVSRGKKDPEVLSAEMTLRIVGEDKIEVISYSTYFAWFELLISFATGKCLKEIYRIETSQSNDGQKKVEYWSGSQGFKEGRGIAVMQQVHLASFIEQCASKVTWKNFSDEGFGSALRWYTEAFSSDTVSVEFILLCTVLETLNKHHSTEISSRLLPKSTYKEIRKQILNVLDEYERSLNMEEIISQYQIFRKKVEKSFAEGSFNQIGSLRTSLKLMLESYKTPYEDLFPNLEFITIRDNIVHTGFGGDNIFSDLRQLGNLVVRLVLSILQYQGDYIESRKIEINGLVDFKNHGLAYKTFPFEKDS
jgi:hypothetical protein